MSNLNSILVTGGTGSFGKAFLKAVLQKTGNQARVVIFSRDELKQHEMAQEFPLKTCPHIRFFIGDVRDQDRLRLAMDRVETVIHAAALKQVPTAEYNPFECIKTNVIGAQNVIEAAMATGVKRVVALSTDKAAAPINLYGATKLCSDKLFIAANNIIGYRDLKLSVVRYGNVMGSRGSVIPFFLKQRKCGVLPITDPEMTRFNISLKEAVEMVFFALDNALGGEIFVPKIPSYKITELAKAIGPQCRMETVGIRAGEKMHEEMITASDAPNTIDAGKYFVIVPSAPEGAADEILKKYIDHYRGKPVPRGFHYSSDNNSEWLGADQLQQLIRNHVDSDFETQAAAPAK